MYVSTVCLHTVSLKTAQKGHKTAHVTSKVEVDQSDLGTTYLYHPPRNHTRPLLLNQTRLLDHQDHKQKKAKTYNSGYSLVVTHLTTNPPVRCLNRAERTGSLVFNVLWSYVEDVAK
jgi:hypothetical protein